tara:strand:+ start:44 stop:433 length:390 start_codon:yes stop_codon:yes gene_type:complete
LRPAHKILLIIISGVILLVTTILLFEGSDEDKLDSNDNKEYSIQQKAQGNSWSIEQKTQKIKECVDEGISIGTCKCIIETLSLDFETIDEFNSSFDSIGEEILKSIINNDKLDTSKIESFADRIAHCLE